MSDFHDYLSYGNDVIGCVLMHPYTIDNFRHLKPEHFHDSYQSIVWMLILRSVKQEIPIKPYLLVTEVCSLCVSDNQNEEAIAKVKEWFISTMSFKPSIKAIEDYGKLLIEYQVKQNILGIIDESKRLLETHGSVITDVTENLISSITKASYNIGWGKHYDDVPTMVDNLLKEMDELRRTGGAVSTGLPSLDELLSGGFHIPDLVLIGGASNMGKTSFAMNCAVHAAKSGLPIGFFSLEMTKSQLMSRVIADLAGIPADKFRRNNLTPEDYYLIDEKRSEMGSMTMLVDDTSRIRIDVLQARARQMKREKNIKILFVDYLQLVSPPEGSKYFSRAEEVSDIAKQLKAIAKELSIPVVALVQLNTKAIAVRENPRPRMEDISEASGIYNEADTVLLLFREEYYHFKKKPSVFDDKKLLEWEAKMPPLVGHAEIILGKSRFGGADDLQVGFNHRMTKFHELGE